MRTLVRFSLALALIGMASPASAQVIHSLQLGGGLFFPKGFDGRTAGDVLVANLTGDVLDPGLTTALAFPKPEGCFDQFDFTSRPPSCIKAFRGGQFSGEWNIGFGDRLEVGIGLGFYRRTVQSEYRDLQNETGASIAQDIKLRMVPLTGVVRFMPFGRAGDFQPYVGAGLSAINYRYTEVGEFVDYSSYFDTGFIEIFDNFEDPYVAKGWTGAPVLLGGIRLPLGGDMLFGLARQDPQFLAGFDRIIESGGLVLYQRR